MQPALARPAQQSQQHWIMSQQVLSPLVQVTLQPVFVISTLQTPQVRLQVHTGTPFMVKQQETIPPWSIVQRFCTVAQAVVSSQLQVIVIPPVHFSNLKVHRGTMTIDPPDTGVMLGIPVIVPIPGIPMPVRSINMAVVIGSPPENVVKTPKPCRNGPGDPLARPGKSPEPTAPR